MWSRWGGVWIKQSVEAFPKRNEREMRPGLTKNWGKSVLG
jgi:hypothetical protein